ncbi:hypothetical protein [Mucilaginibacter sp. PPCGB 2223]|uniref:hypothetical protein n=1 Tax=Mucilaginibacter sp. PPCGB 2223 TaxID=1886027 RepID=UPI0011129543|nr:hypothetical protein [Mucilaginibacter sp. PPCGB 2223]
MIRKISAYLLALYFLAGSMLLPLGDFSLIKDLPQMYRAYQKLAPAQEQDVFDFIGDYLLNGKALLGHNKHDAPESPQSGIQFQHATVSYGLTAAYIQLEQVIVNGQTIEHLQNDLPVNTSDFYPELFRPPSAA